MEPANGSSKKDRPLIEVVLEVPGQSLTSGIDEAAETVGPITAARNTSAQRPDVQSPPFESPKLQQVSHEEVMLVPPKPPADVFDEPIPNRTGKLAAYSHNVMQSPVIHHDATCDGCDDCDSLGCDSLGCGVFGCDSCDSYCDTIGCDSMGCCPQPWYRRWSNTSLSFHRDRWFGGIEYLMMWSRGDRLPPLVTTDISTTPNPDTAGELGQTNTRVLVGDDRIMERLGSGGRLTIGTWLDNRECLSLVARGWLSGQKSYRYDQNQTETSILTRPFLNVGGQTPAQDTLIVAFPGRATGAVQVSADMEAFGADVSIRQFLYGDLGVTLDLLYGYQYMRMNENLQINNTSTSLDPDFAPVGAVLSVADTFNVTNDFNGGQIGLASNYREGCWSFQSLAKVGFGSLRRRATRSGASVTTIDGESAFDDQGLLVRSTNTGTVSDRTFSWVPELDFSLGWHRFANWDVTFGYHIIGLTDALQSSGAIDPELAVNLTEPLTGAPRPSDGLQYRTYYLQGIHFGLQHTY